MYQKMQPYYINKQLKDNGWKSTEEAVFIPWSFSQEDNQLYLKIQKIGKNYKYSCFGKDKKGKIRVLRNITRNTTIINDMDGKGQRVDTNPMSGKEHLLPEPLSLNIKHLMKSGKKVTQEEIKDTIRNIIDDMQRNHCLDILLDQNYYNHEYKQFKQNETDLIEQFKIRKYVGKARQRLANWLKVRFDVILRKNSHEIYILDEANNCYTEVTQDELLYKVSKILGPQLINDDDLKWALSYISDRLDPQHNIVKFSNCIFDMEKLEVISTDKPVFTLVETSYRYNPNAKSTILKEFLDSSLKKTTPEETEETVLGIKQLTGYLFTSGNKLNLLPFLSGVSGGGKSVFANILTEIFGKDKVADLKLQEIDKNTHATSSLVNKHLNIIQDSDSSTINNNSLIKQITGNDPLQVNPKHTAPFVLPKEEVPKTIVVCNNIPFFKKLEPALLERFLIIEFNIKFRGETNENKNLLNDILDNPEEIEWFIYESIQAYKRMIEAEEDFILRKDGDVTRNIVDKHQSPINYLLNKVITDHNPAFNALEYNGTPEPNVKNEECLVYRQDLDKVMQHLAKKEGIDLTLNRKAEIPPKSLISAIRYEFELSDYYVTETNKGKRFYPDLTTNTEYWKILKEITGKDIPEEIKEEIQKAEHKSKEDSEEGENAVQNA